MLINAMEVTGEQASKSIQKGQPHHLPPERRRLLDSSVQTDEANTSEVEPVPDPQTRESPDIFYGLPQEEEVSCQHYYNDIDSHLVHCTFRYLPQADQKEFLGN